jgi:shikimate kinase
MNWNAIGMHVLIMGMSGTGKSSLVLELRKRGYVAYDADEDGFSEPRRDGRWGWRAEQVAELLSRSPAQLLFFAGCSEEQAELPFDYRVLLTAPEPVVIERLRTRTNNPYAKGEQQLSQVLTDFAEIEPLIRRSADLVLPTTEPPARVADAMLRRIAALSPVAP